MRLPLIYIPKTRIKKFLYIEKRYKYKHCIIPIGCDCHPAYMLNSVYLRKNSLPFDWLNIQPVKTFEYVNENINDKFLNFLKDLKLNEKGYYISENYPYSEFMHEKNLNTIDSINKFNRRVGRFLNLIANERVLFLHNIPVNSILDENDLSQYIESVRLFQSRISSNSSIHIYLRFDEDLSENKILADKLFIDLTNMNIHVYKYVRKLKENGIWGDKSEYYNLLKDLGIKLKMAFPKISVK